MSCELTYNLNVVDIGREAHIRGGLCVDLLFGSSVHGSANFRHTTFHSSECAYWKALGKKLV
jgi:hypothetical protein